MNDPKTNDAISRSEALESAELISWYHANQKGKMVPGASSSDEAYVEFNDVVSLLENATAIDAVPVVRCGNCKWYDSAFSVCSKCGVCVNYDFFCADGEKEDAHD